jgi:signal transduction histidine kinase
VEQHRLATLSSQNGLPCDGAQGVIEDQDHAVWLYMDCGLVRIPRHELDAWTAAIAAGTAAKRTVSITLFDTTDGVMSHAGAFGMSPQFAQSRDGRLWFTPGAGVSVLDPHHLPINRLPPPVQIEQITADRKTHEVTSAENGPVRLPALIRDLQIDYTALSLVVAEKNRFRYKLDGYDSDWHDVGTRRQAFYNDLPPRTYRFRVVASNNSGVWNETGAAFDFSIAPAYYQRTSFSVVLAAGALVLLWALYRFRLRQIAFQYDARLQERVNERTRIARDLHDTLLQSFHGLLFRFQAATNLLPERPAEAKRQFESAIDQAAEAITEGRDAVQNLRGSVADTQDLALSIRTLGEELAAAQVKGSGNRTVVDVAVEGTPRNLHPILRDDIYRIAGEALRNAFKHARARRIEVEIRYDDKQFQLRVRDDGKGIDRSVLHEPQEGHFGLSGMRERAELVGGHLDVWSEVGLGTEVDLMIPAVAAYATPRERGRLWSYLARRMRTDV